MDETSLHAYALSPINLYTHVRHNVKDIRDSRRTGV